LAGRFGKERIILWGGVLADNLPARRFYLKMGFEGVVSFTNAAGSECLDMIAIAKPGDR
jgi:hypothetical protein